MDDDTPFGKIYSVYRPFVVTTKLSSIVSMKKKKKTERTRSCNSWHHTYANEAATTRKPSKQKKIGSVYVTEDTMRRREREER